MSRTEIKTFVIKMVKGICSRKGMKPGELPDNAPLDRSGWGLDSLDIAEVSSVLEQHFGHDPYSNRKFALTVGDILDYYASNPPQKGIPALK